MAFVKNERFSNPDTGKTNDLKAVLLAVHNYLKHGSKDYYTQKLISLGVWICKRLKNMWKYI